MNNQVLIEHQIKKMPSDAAATFLMKIFPVDGPNYGDAFKMMAHRSWRRDDQVRLARYYLKKMPFATSKPYEVFASFMSIKTLMSVVKEAMPTNPSDRELVVYYVAPVLKKNIKSEADRNSVNEFLSELKSAEYRNEEGYIAFVHPSNGHDLRKTILRPWVYPVRQRNAGARKRRQRGKILVRSLR